MTISKGPGGVTEEYGFKEVRRGVTCGISRFCCSFECREEFVLRQIEVSKQGVRLFTVNFAHLEVRSPPLFKNTLLYGSVGYNLNTSRVFVHAPDRSYTQFTLKRTI